MRPALYRTTRSYGYSVRLRLSTAVPPLSASPYSHDVLSLSFLHSHSMSSLTWDLIRAAASTSPRTLESASHIYLLAIQEAAPKPEIMDADPSRRDVFIEDMYEMGQPGKSDLNVAHAWKTEFNRLRSSGNTRRPAPMQWVDVQAAVERTLGILRGRLEKFLARRDFLPLWDPPASWETESAAASADFEGSDMRGYLQNLRIPVTQLNETHEALPDLLLYRLGMFALVDEGRLWIRTMEMINDELNVTVMNTSGSGKTRMLFEALCLRWGFYYTCAWQKSTSPYGSRDYTANLTLEKVLARQQDDGTSFRLPGKSSQARVNAEIVEHLSSLVLLARLLVFDLFLSVLRDNFSMMPAFRARLAWVLIQVFPRLSDDGTLHGHVDIFEDLVATLRHLSSADCTTQIALLSSAIPFTHYPSLLIFDEVQTVAKEWKQYFPKNRALLKHVVIAVGEVFPNAKVVIAGTRLYKDDVDAALSSTVWKNRAHKVVSNLGGNFRDENMEVLLRHFLGDFYLRLPDETRSDIMFWLRGRYRFLAVFIQWVLQQGPGVFNVRNVLNNLVHTATLCELPNYPALLPLNLHMKSLIPSSFPRPDTRRVTVPVKCAQQAVLQFITHMTWPRFASDRLQLVDLGIGRFASRKPDGTGVVTISERLVLCSLLNYFETDAALFSIRSLTNTYLSNWTSPGAGAGWGWEDALIYLFWRLFSDDGQVLKDVFHFENADTLEWTGYRARLVSDCDFSSPNGPNIVRRRLTSAMAKTAGGYAETLAWFKTKGRAPFLKPDKNGGPDVMFVLRIDDPSGRRPPQYILVCVQCKNWSRDGGPGAVNEAIFTASPEGLYARMAEGPGKRRVAATLPGILRQFPVVQGTGLPPPSPPGYVLAKPGKRNTRSAKKEGAEHGAAGTTNKQAGDESEDPTILRQPPVYKGGDVDHIAFGDKLEYGVLRVLGMFPQSQLIPRPITRAHGVYPLATISNEALQYASNLGFEGVRHALERAGVPYDEKTEEELLEEHVSLKLADAADKPLFRQMMAEQRASLAEREPPETQERVPLPATTDVIQDTEYPASDSEEMDEEMAGERDSQGSDTQEETDGESSGSHVSESLPGGSRLKRKATDTSINDRPRKF